jgi:acyl-ACP thioesterase
MVEPPSAGGRVHRGGRRVRLADVGPSGRLRLDAVARYLQDIAADDVRDAGLAEEVAWVVRRTVIDVAARPRYDELVELATWCSGVGAAWAERRTTIYGAGRPVIETAAIWVSLDPATMRPVAPGESFHAAYGAAGGGRRVRTTLSVPLPDDDSGPAHPWPLRSTDTDLLGHVNNAVAWAAVEDELVRTLPGAVVLGGEVEYRSAIEPGTTLSVRSRVDPVGLLVWLSGDDPDTPMVAARARTVTGGSGASGAIEPRPGGAAG